MLTSKKCLARTLTSSWRTPSGALSQTTRWVNPWRTVKDRLEVLNKQANLKASKSYTCNARNRGTKNKQIWYYRGQGVSLAKRAEENKEELSEKCNWTMLTIQRTFQEATVWLWTRVSNNPNQGEESSTTSLMHEAVDQGSVSKVKTIPTAYSRNVKLTIILFL